VKYIKIIISSGGGFIGGNLIRLLLKSNYKILNLYKLTYTADLKSLNSFKNYKNYQFKKKVDISNTRKFKIL